jgi:hypothetical protein
MADRRDLDPAPPARRTAALTAAPPAPDQGGPGTARGPAQCDTDSAAPGIAAAGHPGHDPALAPRYRPAPLGRQIRARQHRPPGHPPDRQGPGPAASQGRTPNGDTAGSTASWPLCESRSGRRPYGRSSRPTASSPRRGGPARPGRNSCAARPSRSWPATCSRPACPAAPRPAC